MASKMHKERSRGRNHLCHMKQGKSSAHLSGLNSAMSKLRKVCEANVS